MGKVNSVLDEKNSRLSIVINMLMLNHYRVLLPLRNNTPFSNAKSILYCRAKAFSTDNTTGN